jgi:putative phage-type endonuclease
VSVAKPTKFHRERASGIGGSDAPVLCGVARWKTPLQLWAEKVRALEGDFSEDEEENDLLLWGTLMEPKILEVFGKRSGRIITRPKELIRHPDIDWLIAHLDGEQQDKDLGVGIVEAKNISRYVSDRWEDEVPMEVQVQTQHYLAATGFDYATAVGLVGGHKLIWKDIERNQRFIDALLEREERFWQRVISDNPPTATAADVKFLNTLNPVTEGKKVILDGMGLDLDAELERVLNEIEKQKAVMDPLEEKRDELQAKLKQMMGDAEEAHLPNGQVYTFKEVVRKAHEVQESRYRKFVRKK